MLLSRSPSLVLYLIRSVIWVIALIFDLVGAQLQFCPLTGFEQFWARGKTIASVTDTLAPPKH
jgi:hypothetical protein